MGSNYQAALPAFIYRSMLLTTIYKLEGKNSTLIKRKIIKRIKRYEKGKTISFDNDQPFSQHEEITYKLDAKT